MSSVLGSAVPVVALGTQALSQYSVTSVRIWTSLGTWEVRTVMASLC